MRQMLSEVTELEFQEEANAMDGWNLEQEEEVVKGTGWEALIRTRTKCSHH
jgi:hypothetical protein